MGPITAKSITGYVKPTFRTRLGFRTPSGVGKSSMPEPRGSSTESYGESGFERGLGLTDAAQNRTHRSEEHTSELQSLMRISYAVFFLKKKKQNKSKVIHTTR